MKILDSDHCVALLRGRLDLTGRVSAGEQLATTAVNAGELAYGAHKSARPAENLARVNLLLSQLIVVPYDESAAREFGRLKAELELAGTRLHDLDLQIASIALRVGAVLLTHNQQHFARVPGLDLADWIDGQK